MRIIYQRKSLQKAQKVGVLKNLATNLCPRTMCTLLCFTAPLLLVMAPPTLFSCGNVDAEAISRRGTLVLYTYFPVDVDGGKSVGFSTGILVLKDQKSWNIFLFIFIYIYVLVDILDCLIMYQEARTDWLTCMCILPRPRVPVGSYGLRRTSGWNRNHLQRCASSRGNHR